MHPKAQALLSLHTDFLMHQLSGSALTQRIDEELSLLLQQLRDRRLHELVDHPDLVQFLQKHLLGYQPSAELRSEIRNQLLRLMNSCVFKELSPQLLLKDAEVENLIRTVLAQKEVLQSVIHSSLSNPVYADVLSDLLYHSIKDYLLQENLLTKKVPGMASLMKIGKGMVEKMGNLEENFEKAIKNYIRKNIESSINLSEQLILKACDGPGIERALLDIWKKIQHQPVHQLSQHLRSEHLQLLDDVVQEAWNRWRTSALSQRLLEEIIQSWFNAHTDSTLEQLLNLAHLDVRTVVRDLLPVIEPATTLLVDSGFLQQRLRAQLQEFYQQENIQQLLIRE